MGQLKEVSQSLNGCFGFFKDALDVVELMQDNGELSTEICDAISDKIFCVIQELDYFELFVNRLSECKNEAEMEAIINEDNNN